MAVPRPTFTTYAPWGSRAKRAPFRMCAVSAVPGRAIIRFRVRGSTWSNWETGSTSSKASWARPLRLSPVILEAPIPRRRSATLAPMSPVPRMVNALSRMDRMGSWLLHPRFRTTSSYSGIRRRSISSTMTTCSAMVTP